MKKKLTIKQKQDILIQTIKEGLQKNPQGYAVFGVEKEVVNPLIKQGIIHKDTFRYTGGATLARK